MRHRSLLLALLGLLCSLPAHAQSGGGYPHGFLFGAWIGGYLPAPTTLSGRECLASPTVIFSRDVILRANRLDASYEQNLVETVRDSGDGVEFRLVRIGGSSLADRGPFGAGAAAMEPPGFGCGNPAILRVQRRGANEISFPNCPAFPYPLVRCPGN